MEFENYWTEKHGLFQWRESQTRGWIPDESVHADPPQPAAQLCSPGHAGDKGPVPEAPCSCRQPFCFPVPGPPASHPPAASLARASGHSRRCAFGPSDFSQHLVDTQTVNKCANMSLSRAGISDKHEYKWCCIPISANVLRSSWSAGSAEWADTRGSAPRGS